MQLLLGDDLELRAYASLTYARCILAGAGAGTFHLFDAFRENLSHAQL
jgi:hypothetical protein